VWSRNIKNGCSIYIYDISRLRVKDLHSATCIYVVRRLRVKDKWNYTVTLPSAFIACAGTASFVNCMGVWPCSVKLNYMGVWPRSVKLNCMGVWPRSVKLKRTEMKDCDFFFQGKILLFSFMGSGKWLITSVRIVCAPTKTRTERLQMESQFSVWSSLLIETSKI